MKDIKSIVSLLLVIAVTVFAVQNFAMVEIQFLLWSFSMPRALLVVILAGGGFLVGLLFAKRGK